MSQFVSWFVFIIARRLAARVDTGRYHHDESPSLLSAMRSAFARRSAAPQLRLIAAFEGVSPHIATVCIVQGSVLDYGHDHAHDTEANVHGTTPPQIRSAIVNAANEGCLGGGGVDGAISSAGTRPKNAKVQETHTDAVSVSHATLPLFPSLDSMVRKAAFACTRTDLNFPFYNYWKTRKMTMTRAA